MSKDRLGVSSQNDFPNIFPDSGKVVVNWLDIKLNRLADVLKRLAFVFSFGYASGKRWHINGKTAFLGRL
jgi:hypothetical protein